MLTGSIFLIGDFSCMSLTEVDGEGELGLQAIAGHLVYTCELLGGIIPPYSLTEAQHAHGQHHPHSGPLLQI
jgi:hypothetical protein